MGSALFTLLSFENHGFKFYLPSYLFTLTSDTAKCVPSSISDLNTSGTPEKHFVKQKVII
jgi:hypothetical protein